MTDYMNRIAHALNQSVRDDHSAERALLDTVRTLAQ